MEGGVVGNIVEEGSEDEIDIDIGIGKINGGSIYI